MIGKYVRGFRHLCKCVGNGPKQVLFTSVTRHFTGTAILAKLRGGEHAILLFNNQHGDRSVHSSIIMTTELRELCNSFGFEKYNYCLTLTDDTFISIGSEAIILPDDFDDLFDTFNKQNKKIVEQVKVKYSGDFNCYFAKYFFVLTDGSPNMFSWAMTNLYKNGVSSTTLKHVIDWCKNYPQLVRNLKKGTPTAYNGFGEIQELVSEMIALRKNKRANLVINMFNTAQKKLLKNVELNSVNLETFSKFSILSDIKKRNFVRKMSTIEDANEIMRQMKLLTNIHFEWNRESFCEFINGADGINCEVIYDNNNIIVVKVNDYETVKQLAKTTNWCISKNKRFWNEYIELRNGKSTQYVLFDFNKKEDDELSIVGFTSTNNGITHAHSFSNKNLMEETREYPYIRCFVEHRKNIISILKSANLSESMFCDFEKQKYNWNKTDFIKFLEYCMDESEYDIILDNGDKLVVETTSQMVRFIIGKRYDRNFINDRSPKKLILFCDFSLQETDPNRLMFSIINFNEKKQEEYPSMVFDMFCRSQVNVTFNTLLSSFGLPYTTICRTENETDVLFDAFSTYNIVKLNELLGNKELIKHLIKESKNKQSNNIQNDIYSYIQDSIINVNTTEIINVFYNNNISIGELIGKRNMDNLLSNLCYEVLRYYRCNNKVPTNDELNMLYNNNWRYEKSYLVGVYSALITILQRETCKNCIGSGFISMILETSSKQELCVKLINLTLPFIIDKYGLIKELVEPIVDMDNRYAMQILVDNNIHNVVSDEFVKRLPTTHPFYDLFAKLSKKNELVGVKVC